jgi:hypothetical protein
MSTALVSKPGITRQSAGSAVPMQWSQSWFRDFISDHLKGADVRNAIGVNGIVVSGNISSPYATISIGNTPAGGGTRLNGALEISGFAGLAAAYGTVNAWATGMAGSQSRIFFGDGSGWKLNFSSRTGGVTTDLITFSDGGGALGTTLITLTGANPSFGFVNNAASGRSYLIQAYVNGVSNAGFGIFDQTSAQKIVSCDANDQWVFYPSIGSGTTVTIDPPATGGGATSLAVGTNNAVSTNIGIDVVSGSNQNVGIEVTGTMGAAFGDYGTLNTALVMNSVGANFGQIGNNASQLWSLGSTNVGSGIGVPGNIVFEWGNTGDQAFFPNLGTTASAANAFLVSGTSNKLQRSTSSLRYKTNVVSVQGADIDALLQMRPVIYTSLCAGDDPKTAHLGFIAEEMALIDPRLVHWTPNQVDSRGTGVPGATLVPESVQYDRIVTLLVGALQTLAQRVAALEAAAGPLSLTGKYGLTGTNVVTTPSVVTVLPPVAVPPDMGPTALELQSTQVSAT